jgi:hypothetical protein
VTIPWIETDVPVNGLEAPLPCTSWIRVFGSPQVKISAVVKLKT